MFPSPCRISTLRPPIAWRPSSSMILFNYSHSCWSFAFTSNVTNAKPRDRPEFFSRMIATSTTFPYDFM